MSHPLGDLPLTITERTPLRWRAHSADGRRTSPSWKLWVRGGDIYMCQRSMGKDLKISLHKSGSFSTSLVNDEMAATRLGPGQSRHLAIWDRPVQLAPGWTLMCEVIHPEIELGAFFEEGIDRLAFVDLPVGRDFAVHISGFLSEPALIETKLNFVD